MIMPKYVPEYSCLFSTHHSATNQKFCIIVYITTYNLYFLLLLVFIQFYIATNDGHRLVNHQQQFLENWFIFNELLVLLNLFNFWWDSDMLDVSFKTLIGKKRESVNCVVQCESKTD